MLRALLVIILGVFLSSCASTTSKDTKTFKGSMPYVEGTPTHELLKAIPELDQPMISIAVYRLQTLQVRENLVQSFLNYQLSLHKVVILL